MRGLIASAPVIACYKIGEPSEVQRDNSQAGLGVAGLGEPSVNGD